MYPARISRLVCIAITALASLKAADTSFWIEPCSVMISSCKAADADLARWALAAWQEASDQKLNFIETKDRATALLRFRWADKNSGLYGEAVPILVQGRRGSELHILIPDDDAKQDPLQRDTVVYLTCLHESGHALGLSHTRAFADIMYNFQFGGDITEYFGRYRRRLKTHDDVQRNPGISPADREALAESIKRGSLPGN